MNYHNHKDQIITLYQKNRKLKYYKCSKINKLEKKMPDCSRGKKFIVFKKIQPQLTQLIQIEVKAKLVSKEKCQAVIIYEKEIKNIHNCMIFIHLTVKDQ